MSSPFEQNHFDHMRNDPENYLWGIFYYNRKDDRYVLPKRNRMMGWTFNFAHPVSWLVLLALLAAIFGLSYLG